MSLAEWMKYMAVWGRSGPTADNNFGQIAWPFEVLPLQDVANITGDVAAQVSVTLDQNVRFQDRPTLRIDIPAGVSGLAKVMGTSGVTASIPQGWDLTNLCVAIMATDITQVSAVYPYIGDATYANFWSKDQTKTTYSFPDTGYMESNKWVFFKVGDANGPTTLPVSGGSPTLSTRLRAKVSINLVASGHQQSIWVAFAGVMPKRKKPTIVVTLDDGYSTWWSFVAPLCRYYGIPVSMGVIANQVGQVGYLRDWQIAELDADRSGLFDFCNHTYSHLYYDGTNGDACIADYLANAHFMNSTLNISGDGPWHVFYPGGASNMGLYRKMAAAGFLTGRKLQPCWPFGQDQTLAYAEEQGRYVLNVIKNLENTTTYAQATAAIDACVARNEFGVLTGHSFSTSASTLAWSYENLEKVFQYLAALRDAGTIDIKSISRWFADLTGRHCRKR